MTRRNTLRDCALRSCGLALQFLAHTSAKPAAAIPVTPKATGLPRRSPWRLAMRAMRTLVERTGSRNEMSSARTGFAIIEAPSILGLRPTGVERLPKALLSAGLAERLDARNAGEVSSPPYDDRRDIETKMLNAHALADYSISLADAVAQVLDECERPLVLGGDCSIILGNLLALRRRGRYGLLFIDGHADFYQPEANINGEAASSELAFATGRGPAVMTTFEGLRPLVRDEDVVVIGYRDADEAASYGSQPLPPAMPAHDLASLRRSGARTTARAAVDHLSRPELDGFWIHFDVDALDDAIMPAVDYRQPGGLSWSEAREILGVAMASRRAAGIDVTIFNPSLDPSGDIARSLVDMIAGALN
jgi:arginase